MSGNRQELGGVRGKLCNRRVTLLPIPKTLFAAAELLEENIKGFQIVDFRSGQPTVTFGTPALPLHQVLPFMPALAVVNDLVDKPLLLADGRDNWSRLGVCA